MLVKIKQLLLLVLFFAVTGYMACRKMDSLTTEEPSPQVKESRFFNEHKSSNPQVQGIADYVKRQNDKLGFVEKTTQMIGYPRWDKAMVIEKPVNQLLEDEGGNQQVTYIPFVRDSQTYVNAALAVVTNPWDTTTGYLCDWQYQNREFGTYSDSSAEKLAILFMALDNGVFGHEVFSITDARLFANAAIVFGTPLRRIKISVNGTAGLTETQTPVEICTLQPSGNCNCNHPSGICQDWETGCSVCSIETCYTVWVTIGGGGIGGDDGGGPTGGDPGSGTGGGGGSGSGSGVPPDCQGPIVPSGNLIEINAPCTPGWEPIEPDEPAATDPCNKIAPLAANPDYRQNFQRLEDSTTSNKEYGFYGTTNGVYYFVEGNAAGQDGINFTIYTAITTIMHSHFAGGLPIFSSDDLEQIGTLFKSSYTNPATFVAGVATETGSYVITIENQNKFQDFIDNFLSLDGLGQRSIERLYQQYSIGGSSTPIESLKFFIQLLNNTDAGLAVMKANDDFTAFRKLSINNNSIVYTPCQ